MLPLVIAYPSSTASAALYPCRRQCWHRAYTIGLERSKRGGKAVSARLPVRNRIPSSVGEFCAMDDTKIYRKLPRYPAKRLVPIHKEGIKGELAHAFERMKCQLKKARRAVRSGRRRTPIMMQSDDKASLRMPRDLCPALDI